MKEINLMRPVIDFVFKALFAGKKRESKIILKHFLNSLLKPKDNDKIKEIVYLNPFNDKEYEKDKLSIMDIKVETEKGELIDIEVQINNVDNYRKRSLYYWSKLYGETINEAQAYETLKKCVVVNILDFKLFDNTDRYHNKFKIMEEKEKFELTDDLEIHYIELEKFNDSKNIKKMNDLEKWITFIKDAGEKEKREIVKDIRKNSEVINMAGRMLEELSADEKARQLYLAREKALLDQKSAMVYQKIKLKEAEEKGMQRGLEKGIEKGLEKGIEKGIEKGKKEEKILVARQALQKGIDIDTVVDITELDREEVEKLKESIEKGSNTN
ncbi:Rpn family recombination-promoting nuclease/putative transposase [Dethiothermospora halolimnae]|uniref:Rpn family recombination-promoting nuclease/putative transposase n=1 Tax=Dethiothermospora halolimnae TaxID=3114390 RepID=UPI003CCC0FE1